MSRRTLSSLPLLALLTACEEVEIAVDIPASTLSGDFTTNGAPFADAQDQTGLLDLRSAIPGDVVDLGLTVEQLFQDLLVIDGTYDVHYAHADGSTVPMNADARLLEGQVVSGPGTLPIDVPAATVEATFTLDGAPFPVAADDSADFYLQPVGTDELIVLGRSHEGAGSVVVVPGTYHVVYDHAAGGSCPINAQARLLEDLVITGDQRLALDVTSRYLRVTFTLDGGAFPVDEYQDATLHLRDRATGGEAFLMVGLRLIPGTYDVLYSHETGDDVPQNVRGTVASAVVIDGSPLDVDVVGLTVEANVTLDGALFPVDEYQDANLFLVGEPSEVDVLVGNTHDAAPSVMVLPGTYHLHYRHETGLGVPQSPNFRLLADQVIGADTVLATDVGSRSTRIWVTLNGAAFPDAGLGTGNVYLRSGPGDEVLMVETGANPFTKSLIAGDYEVVFEYVSGSEVPRNLGAVVGARALE